MNHQIAQHKSLAFQAAIQQGLLNDNNPYVSLVYAQGVETTVQNLNAAFPDDFRHCYAVKANSYLGILKLINKTGMGAEVASIVELELSLNAGITPDQMIFDAPVKTLHEIDRALSLGIDFNIDNFEELARVKSWLENKSTSSSIGFRINPQVGAGGLERTSTATMTSKFGIGLKDTGNREKLIQTYCKYDWLDSIHVHVGSIACPLELISQGIGAVVTLAEEINKKADSLSATKIKKIDMGGGLPVDFTTDGDNPTFSEYRQLLQNNIPVLFSGEYQITTEFGRSIVAKNAFTIGQVEYTKTMGKRSIALTHVGVQALMRSVFESENWKRRISAFNKEGAIKLDNEQIQDIAGPACFAGDVIAKKYKLASLESGDYVMIHDTGAYCFSSHYQYNALPRLPIYSYHIDAENKVIFKLISAGQTVEQVIEDYST